MLRSLLGPSVGSSPPARTPDSQTAVAAQLWAVLVTLVPCYSGEVQWESRV